MSDASTGTRIVLQPEDEYCHEPEAAPTYNESMYFNVYDPDRRVGGWFRLGNRVHEGYAEMSKCLYLPDGRIAFMYGRPRIESNREMRAGGMHIEVVEPLRRLRLHYRGRTCLLARPFEMADPRRAFRENPIVPCRVDLDYEGIAPVFGGRVVRADGSDLELDPERSFARAHYEQHVRARGEIELDGQTFAVEGLGLRDKSWGPRTWQAIAWYRWLPVAFGEDFGMAVSLIAGEGGLRPGGMVLRGGRYVPIRDVAIDTDWDERGYQSALRARVVTDEAAYELEGRVISLIPLRNRRRGPDGVERTTRITEGLTEYRCEGRVGYGLSEYLDQIRDGRPVGADAPKAGAPAVRAGSAPAGGRRSR